MSPPPSEFRRKGKERRNRERRGVERGGKGGRGKRGRKKVGADEKMEGEENWIELKKGCERGNRGRNKVE